MKKWLARISPVLAIIAITLTVSQLTRVRLNSRSTPGETTDAQSRLTIQQVQALAQLVTQRVNVSHVIENQIIGRTGSMRAIVVVRGSVLIATDLSQARFETIDEVAHRAVLLAPQPKLLQVVVDQEHTRVFAVTESGLWRVTPDDGSTKSVLLERCFGDAQRLVTAAGAAAPLRDQARQQAENTITKFMRALGWTVTVKWPPD